MAIIRKFTKRICIIANIVVVLLFLLACANTFLHPAKWWLISLLGLIFPLLLLLVTGFGIFWLFFYSRRLSFISLAALLLGWQNIDTFFAFNFPRKFVEPKPVNALRILTWNVRRWDEFISKKPGASGHRIKMLDFVQEHDADILCFQEFFEPHNAKGFNENIAYIQQSLHYPYYFFSHDYKGANGMYETGVIIFSRYPIVHSDQIKYDSKDSLRASESLILVDLNVNGKTIRVFTTHLQSVLFRNKDFRDFEIIRNVEDSMIEASKSIAKKLKRAYSLRGGQADLVRAQLDKSPYPVIICGDFNDVPNSYSYFRIRGNRQDAFVEKGFGIGRTYVHLSPTLRIDYILADKQFKVFQACKFPLPYSDHYPVVADLQLP
jgi:endonuclease/exonuclease/phosphatase family metal-dependent hydrolase